MQGCERFEGALYEDNITREVSEHLAGCDSCRALAEKLSALQKRTRFDVSVDPAYIAYRKRIILQKLPLPEPRYAGLLRLVRVSIVALFAIALFLPHSKAPQPAPNAAVSQQAQIDFELVKKGSAVELHWKGDTRRSYRVYKGPNPASLKPVQQVKGVAWMDPSPNSSPILFYKIEAL